MKKKKKKITSSYTKLRTERDALKAQVVELEGHIERFKLLLSRRK